MGEREGYLPQDVVGSSTNPSNTGDIPERSFLREHPELLGKPKETELDPNGKLIAERIRDEQGQVAYEKKFRYDATGEPNLIAERFFRYDESGRVIQEDGKKLNGEHGWTTNREYDAEGNVVAERGKITEGKKKGAEWETTTTFSETPDGKYVEETSITVTKEADGKIRETQRINVRNPQTREVVWGWQKTPGDPVPYMEWGQKPE